jgi:hypothetical protein
VAPPARTKGAPRAGGGIPTIAWSRLWHHIRASRAMCRGVPQAGRRVRRRAATGVPARARPRRCPRSSPRWREPRCERSLEGSFGSPCPRTVGGRKCLCELCTGLFGEKPDESQRQALRRPPEPPRVKKWSGTPDYLWTTGRNPALCLLVATFWGEARQWMHSQSCVVRWRNSSPPGLDPARDSAAVRQLATRSRT